MVNAYTVCRMKAREKNVWQK